MRGSGGRARGRSSSSAGGRWWGMGELELEEVYLVVRVVGVGWALGVAARAARARPWAPSGVKAKVAQAVDSAVAVV